MSEVDRAAFGVVGDKDNAARRGEGELVRGEGREEGLEGLHEEGEVGRTAWSWLREGCKHELLRKLEVSDG